MKMAREVAVSASQTGNYFRCPLKEEIGAEAAPTKSEVK
jgi:hypothetical protein